MSRFAPLLMLASLCLPSIVAGQGDVGGAIDIDTDAKSGEKPAFKPLFPTHPGIVAAYRSQVYETVDGKPIPAGEEEIILFKHLSETKTNGLHFWHLQHTIAAADDIQLDNFPRIKLSEFAHQWISWEYYDTDRQAYMSVGGTYAEYLFGNRNTRAEPFTLVRYPPTRIGEVTQDEDLGTITVLELKKKVTVPAGTFECIVYSIDDSTAEHRDFFEPLIEEVEIEGEEAEAAPEEEEGLDVEPVPTITIEAWCPGGGCISSEQYEVQEGKRELTWKEELIMLHIPEKKSGSEKKSGE